MTAGFLYAVYYCDYLDLFDHICFGCLSSSGNMELRKRNFLCEYHLHKSHDQLKDKHMTGVDGMLDKALASEFWGQGSNHAARPSTRLGDLRTL